MSLTQQKCHLCNEMKDVVMHSPQSRYFKICLDCYNEQDQKNPKDFGRPKRKKDYGTHQPD